MKVTIKINAANGGFKMEEVFEGDKAEIMSAHSECIKELEPGGTIEMIDTDTGRQISFATKPRR